MALQRTITGGPGKFDLMVATFNYQPADFWFSDPSAVFPVRITDFMPLDQETETCRIAGFIRHPRPIQKHQDFVAIYGMNDRKGVATFQCICTGCANTLDENGFCEGCAGGLPLAICAKLQLQELPPLGATTTLGIGLTVDEAALFEKFSPSFPSMVLKNRTIRKLSVGGHVCLFVFEGNRVIGRATVKSITPLSPTVGDVLDRQADVEVALVLRSTH